MKRIVGYGLALLVVAALAVSWLFAGALYSNDPELRTVSNVDRDHPLVARAVAEARLTIPPSAEDFAAQAAGDAGFSAVAFSLPTADLRSFLTDSNVPMPFDENATPPPPTTALGWEPTDPTALVTVTDRTGDRHRLIALDLRDADTARILARTAPNP